MRFISVPGIVVEVPRKKTKKGREREGEGMWGIRRRADGHTQRATEDRWTIETSKKDDQQWIGSRAIPFIGTLAPKNILGERGMDMHSAHPQFHQLPSSQVPPSSVKTRIFSVESLNRPSQQMSSSFSLSYSQLLCKQRERLNSRRKHQIYPTIE